MTAAELCPAVAVVPGPAPYEHTCIKYVGHTGAHVCRHCGRTWNSEGTDR